MNKLTLFGATFVLVATLSATAQSASNGMAAKPKPIPVTAGQSQKISASMGVSSTDVIPGMQVVGPDQVLIGTVLQAGETPDGIRAVAIVMDGKRAVLDLSEMHLADGVLISNTTKAELLTKAARSGARP